MATSPPPKGLPGFLRRSLRNAYEEDAPDGSRTPAEDESARPESESEASESADAAAAAAAAAAVTDEAAEASTLDESEELKREKEAVDAAASRVNRKFRFGLSLGGGGKEGDGDGEAAAADAETAPAGSPAAVREGNGGLTRMPGVLSTKAASVPHEIGGHSSNDVGDRDHTHGSSSDVPPPPSGQNSADPSQAGGGDASSPNSDRMSYKELTFENTINSPVVNVRDLRRLAWNGIPQRHRAQAWQILLGYLPANASRRQQALDRKRAEYRDAIGQHYDIDDNSRTGQEQETLRQVLVDVPRTAPDVALFRDGRIRQLLGRLLYIWACRHPASSYVQGINDLATPLISVYLSGYYGGRDVTDGKDIDDVPDDVLFEVEADTYWCLTNLLAGIQDHYTADQPGVQRMVMRLEELVARIDADLTEYLRSTGIEFFQFAFKWMNCLLLREFNLHCVMRLWDTYLSEGDGGFEDFHVYVCAAFLCQFSAEVRSMEFDELFGFMQNMPTSDWSDSEVEIVLSQAFVLSTLFEGSDAHLTSQRS